MADLKNRSRLGRGLSGLMGGAIQAEVPAVPVVQVDADAHLSNALPPAAAVTGQPIELPIEQIQPNPYQPRKTFDEAALSELAASITTNGLIQPIVVRRLGPDRYQLIAGERRLRASKQAGLTHIPAVLRDAEASAQAQMALVENIQRADLNPLERAFGYQALLTELGLTQAELSVRLGEDRSVISNHLRLLDLHQEVQQHVREGRITLGHAKVLAGVVSHEEQQRLGNLVATQGLTVRNLERILATPAASAMPPADQVDRPTGAAAHLRDLELRMSKSLGLRVQIRSAASKGKGKLVLHYNSLDEFDAVAKKLGLDVDE